MTIQGFKNLWTVLLHLKTQTILFVVTGFLKMAVETFMFGIWFGIYLYIWLYVCIYIYIYKV